MPDRPIPHSSFRIHHSGFTLVEMLVVVGIVAIILTIAVVSLRAITGGTQEGAARTMLKTVFASARAEAASKGAVVGVRFQQYHYPPDYLSAAYPPRMGEEGATYAVIIYPLRTQANRGTIAFRFIQSQPAGQPQIDANTMVQSDVLYVAAEGRDPFRFPAGVEIADDVVANPQNLPAIEANNNAMLQGANLTDSTGFTVLFAPNGQVAVRRVAVIQRNNRDSVFYGPDYRQLIARGDPGYDANYDDPRPADISPPLLRDDRPNGSPTIPLSPIEMSQNSFWLYDQAARRAAGTLPWTNYLKQIQGSAQILINPYTGQLQKAAGG